MKWLVISLVGCGIVVLVAAVVGGVLGYQAWKKLAKTMAGMTQLAPATPAAQACFAEVAKYAAAAEVPAIVAADLDPAKGQETAVLVGDKIVVLDAAGAELRTFSTGLPIIPPTSFGGVRFDITTGRLKAGTLKGRPGLVASSMVSYDVVAYDTSGTELWRNSTAGAQVTTLEVADLDGDGESEVLAGRSSQLGLTCLDSSGGTRWTYAAQTQPYVVLAADGDHDGKPEVYVGDLGQAVTILDARGQTTGAWATSRSETALSAADLDGDGKLEFLAIAPDVASQTGPSAAQPTLQSIFQLSVLGLAADGSETWKAPLGGGLPIMASFSPAAGDLDGDGKGEWILNGPDGTLRVYDKKGAELGRQAFGQYLHGLAVVPAKGKPARVWVGSGKEVLGLEWRKWAGTTATSGAGPKRDGAKRSGKAGGPGS